ncbi:hypothetical protein CRUP_003929 [Coryphaenoides rupestris]|nr:hypothetical protein CRUP_003929 [Coryphaenoides rupestris]
MVSRQTAAAPSSSSSSTHPAAPSSSSSTPPSSCPGGRSAQDSRQRSWGACVEVDSDTEAVANQGFKLGCISCKMRGEVPATASVKWFFKAHHENAFTQIYSYQDKMGGVVDERFSERLKWNGTKKSYDLQDGSVYILNVTYDDTGTYCCIFNRTLLYPNHAGHTHVNKTFSITVVPKLNRAMASILSEVMMYVSIIGLQLWLLVEMVYCYGKISSSSREEARRESM